MIHGGLLGMERRRVVAKGLIGKAFEVGLIFVLAVDGKEEVEVRIEMEEETEK